MELLMISKGLMGLAAILSLWFIIRGLMLTQSINAADADVMQVQAVVRQIKPRKGFDTHAVVTISTDDAVVHVTCVIPCGWFHMRRPKVTDLIPVLWRRGDVQAIAVQTIKDGQTMLILGFAALVVIAGLYALLF